jgi:4-hydroxy-3-methylbut-2-enyl diphosphate reductase IspH
MKKLLTAIFCATALAGALSAAGELTRASVVERLDSCEAILQSIQGNYKTAIPADILRRAKGIVIVATSQCLRGKVDLWLVIGDPMSSNSNRLRELGADSGVPAHLVLTAAQIDPAWLRGMATIGITSGASTPEGSVAAVVARLRELGATSVEEVDGIPETIEFSLPLEVR